MEKFDPSLKQTFSDLFINLSSGWLGAAFIIPITSRKPIRVNTWLLISNLLFGILFLIIAYKLKQ